MKTKFFALLGSLLLVAGLSVVLFARKPLTPQEELILRNAEAIAQNEGTPVGSCVRNSGPNGEYGLKMFCDSKTNTDMIYPCPTAPTYGYSLENNKDRCTK